MLLLLQVMLGSIGIAFVFAIGVWLGMQVREQVAAPVIVTAPDYLRSHIESLSQIQALVTQLSEPLDLTNAATAIQQALRDVSQIVETMNAGLNVAVPAPPPKTSAPAATVADSPPSDADNRPLVFSSTASTSSPRSRKARRNYDKIQYMAVCRGGHPPPPDAFIAVECRDIGTDGMSFVCPAAPDSSAVIISLGNEPSLFFMLCEVVACDRIDEVTYRVDCHFVKRIDQEICRWNPERRAIESRMADEFRTQHA